MPINQTFKVIDLTTGSLRFPLPNNIIDAANFATLKKNFDYGPHAGILELRSLIAQKLRRENNIPVTEERIIITAGAKQAIDHVVRATIHHDDEAIIISPYFFAYPLQVILSGGIPIIVQTNAKNCFLPNIEIIEQQITQRTKLIIVNSPCNPTGAVYPQNLLRSIARVANKYNVTVISDEVYGNTVFKGTPFCSLASYSKDSASSVVTVGSFSKAYAMPGWRLGYLAAPSLSFAKRIIELQRICCSGPSMISQFAALAALKGDQTCFQDLAALCEKQCQFTLDQLRTIPYLQVFQPSGGFYCLVSIKALIGQKINGKIISDAESMANILREEIGVKVVSGVAFGAPDNIRLTFAIDNILLKQGLERIKTLFRSSLNH